MTADCQILSARVTFSEHPFISPMILSRGAIEGITQATATVEVEVGGRRGIGRGAIYLSDLWAWPDPEKSHEERDAALRGLCMHFAESLPDWCGVIAHPLEQGLRLHEQACSASSAHPALALAMCASPFDAAIHDAVGHALNCSAFSFYNEDASVPSADLFFPNTGATAAVRAALLPSPEQTLTAWWIVGANDDLETKIRPNAESRGIHHFKIKLLARDAMEDARRTAQVVSTATTWQIPNVRISIDTNEANPDAESVTQFLNILESEFPYAYDALDYLEQPTGRDITEHAFDWAPVTRRKSVLLDEGLTSLDLLPLAAQQNWSGFAIKTCKGHSFALTAAAWARQNGMCLTMQDLTNPGIAAIHSALFASHIPTLNGIELNSPQYTPTANAAWLPRLEMLFNPKKGRHGVPIPLPVGLGSSL